MNIVEMELGSALVIEAKIIGHKEANDTNLSTHTQKLLTILYFSRVQLRAIQRFPELKLCIPSAKNELLHGILLLRNVDHDTLQKRHLKSLLTIANFFGVVIRFFSNLLWNPFNITTLLMIYIEDCRSEYRTKESQDQEIFTLETINLIFFPPKLKAFWPGNKEINDNKFELLLLLLLPLCLVYTRSDPEYSTNVFYIRSSKGAYIIYIV